MHADARAQWHQSLGDNYFIFLDESGNYDFSSNGTRYLIYTAISGGNVCTGIEELHHLKHFVLACGVELEYFHAAQDKQMVRDAVFNIIGGLKGVRVDSIVIEKAKTAPSIRPLDRIYPKMFDILFRYLIQGLPITPRRLQIFFDKPCKDRKAVEKGFHLALAPYATASPYSILMHDSKSHPYLQFADYCGWAIYRRWQNADMRSHKLIRPFIANEFDVFRNGTIRWY